MVIPLSKSSRADCAPTNTRLLGDSMTASNIPGANSPLECRCCSNSGGTMMSRKRCVCPSIKPGSKVTLPRSIVFASLGVCDWSCEGKPTSLILLSSISTAAGDRTFPERGSSKRPAFIRVVGKGDSAASCVAANIPTAKGKIRPTFICSFWMRCIEIIIVPAPEKF